MTYKAQELIKTGMRYTTLSPDIIDLIAQSGSPSAIGLFAWLHSRPDGWVFRKAHIWKELSYTDWKWRQDRRILEQLDLFYSINTKTGKRYVLNQFPIKKEKTASNI